MKKIVTASVMASVLFTGCKKTEVTTADFNQLSATVIHNFVHTVAIGGYTELQTKAAALHNAIIALDANTTEANLTAAKYAWKDVRSTWEKCEGFIFGPVDTYEYDPETDTWPVNFNDLEALLADHSHSLDVADIESLSNRALKGYHPIEYILWGKKNAPQTAANLAANARQKTYIVSLAAALKAQADLLYNSWIASGGNYADKLLMPGSANPEYKKKQDVFLAMLEGMAGICEEVAEGKMNDPFVAAVLDPLEGAKLVESPFSGNSVTDFRNNIIGAYNVYLGKFMVDGAGINELVRAKNISLDNMICQKFEAAIGSFDNISLPYEDAIALQPTQCQNTMTAIGELASVLDNDLRNFITINITD